MMAFRQDVHRLYRINVDGSSYNESEMYNSRPSGFTTSVQSYREPNVFLDLRNYFASSDRENLAEPVPDLYTENEERFYSRSSDYICPHSASRSREIRSDYKSQAPRSERYSTAYPKDTCDADDSGRFHEIKHASYEDKSDYQMVKEGSVSATFSSCTRSDYTSHAAWSERYQTSYSTKMPDDKGATISPKNEYISASDKSGYQTMKEGGWTSRKYFMRSHGPSICELGDFHEVKDPLEGYRRVDAQAAEKGTPEAERDFDRTHECNTHLDLDSDAISGNDDNVRFISDHAGQDHAVIEHDRSSDYREFGPTHTLYYEDYIAGYENDRAHSQGSHKDISSSDCDSTDAIDYYSDSDADDDGSTNEYEWC
jgi:hypothetical protein